jgi:glycosyltransferase involved in cell wall biosynthesis
MANILYSAYFCNPFESSESYTAVKWLEVLLKEHNVKLLTNRSCAEALESYFNPMPHNLEVIGFDIPNWLEKKRKMQLYPGYFSFDSKSYKYVKQNKELLDWTDVILKKTPSSFRYYTSLYKLNKPLVVGPIGGGLQIPKELKSYFKKEPKLNKLRVLDRWILRFPPFSKQLKSSHKLLITLDYLREVLPQQYVHKMITILDTGINIGDRKIAVAPKQNDKLNLLYVGKLVRYKGAELLIKSLIPLKGKANLVLNVIGDGGERDNLKNIVAQNGLENMVIFHGNMQRTDIFEHYQKADIFCFPSLTEASGNVLLEASLYGLPMLTINNGGPKYMVPDEGAIKINIQSEEKIIEELTKGITTLMASPEKRQAMGQANYDFVVNNFSWEVLEKKINDFFGQYNRPGTAARAAEQRERERDGIAA